MARPRSAVSAGEGESRPPGFHLDWITRRCRHRHLHETVLQHALRHAAVRQGGFPQARPPHTLCHSFATHPLADGNEICTLHKLPGHREVTIP